MSIKFVLSLWFHLRFPEAAYQKNYLLFLLTFKELSYISDGIEGPEILNLELVRLVLAYKEKEILFSSGKAEINS